MPTYDYECSSCGHTFEAMQKMSDDPLKACPQCGKSVRRLIGSGAGFIFKGSGFYSTDYRKKDPSVTPAAETSKPNTCPKQKEGCSGCSAA